MCTIAILEMSSVISASRLSCSRIPGRGRLTRWQEVPMEGRLAKIAPAALLKIMAFLTRRRSSSHRDTARRRPARLKGRFA